MRAGEVNPGLGLLILALTLAPTLLCGVAAQAAAARVTFEFAGVKRTALVVEAERLKKARRALIIVLHGSTGSGLRIRRNLELDEAVGNSGAIVVYPDAIDGRWALTPGVDKGDDSSFVTAIVNRLVGEGRVNPRRVYVVGASTGGMMAMRLACEHADLFTGAAAIIANMPVELAGACNPARPIAFLLINGTADPRVPYQGGPLVKTDHVGDVISTDATLMRFAGPAGCGGGRDQTLFPIRNPRSGSRAYLEKFANCKVPVELVRIEGGGHTIPGHWNGGDAGAVVGAHSVDADAAKLVVDFFRRVGG